MSEQLVLPGFQRPSAPARTDNLFLAIVPPDGVIPVIEELTRQSRRDYELRGRALAPSCFHVSLHSIDIHNGFSSGLIDVVNTAARTVSSRRFKISFHRALSFRHRGTKRPFVLRAGSDTTALVAFHRALGEAVTRAGLGRWVTWRFTPHMTLLYDQRLVAEHAIEAIGWTVTDFVLVHSLVGQGKHVHLARWPLCG